MKLTEYRPQQAKHILVYGPPKSGKTELVGQLAQRFKLWWFDLEDGIKTLLRPDSAAKDHLDNVELFRIPDSTTFPIGIETMLKVFKNGPPLDICHEHGKVSCPDCRKNSKPTSHFDISKLTVDKDIIIVDSWSQLSESSMNYIMKKQIAAEDFDAKAGWDEYGKQGRIHERLGSFIQTAPLNIVVISHEIMVEMEDKSKKIVPIGGTSNVSKVFAKYFDEVVYTELVNKKHSAISSTTAKSSVLAGSRSGIDLKPGQTLLDMFT
jgi:hypothetical protein